MQDELRSIYRMVRKPGLLHSVDKPYQFLGGMGDGHIVVFTLSSFFGKVGGKGGIPNADVLGGVVKSKTQVSRAPLFHVGVAVVELSRLVGGGGQAGVSQNLVGRVKAGEVTQMQTYVAAL